MKDKVNEAKPLKSLIEDCGFTQKEFALRVGVHYNSIKAYVAGEKSPTVNVFADMCRVLNKSPKTVLEALGIDTTGIPNDWEIDGIEPKKT